MQKLLTFFIKNINVFAILHDRNFTLSLTNNMFFCFLSFEQLGPDGQVPEIFHKTISAFE